MSPVELRRIIAEWRLRVSRVKNILQPPTWSEKQWRQFAQALALLVRDHGRSWIIDPNVYWDLRWKLQEGGELVCQVEHIPGEKTSLVVAQTGGFAAEVNSYTWLWAEFNMAGDFSRDPYWVEGTWKEALTTLLTPLDRQSSYLLAGRTDTPTALLEQEGARPNEAYFHLSLMEGDRGIYAETPNGAYAGAEAAVWDGGAVPDEAAPMEAAPVESIPENGIYPASPEITWERSALQPDGREGRLRRRKAELRRTRHARRIEPSSPRREEKFIASMN
jgi:hypothetical protein